MFKKAERKQAKLRLALCGPSGSGKTYSALKIAKGLGGSCAMIDTERGSGELYAHIHDYDVCQISPPFTPDKYILAIKEAEKAGYQVLIIDSLSHAWAGEGGILEIHDKAVKASRSGNSFNAWREVTPQHNKLVDAILDANMHVIVTMRSKVSYEIIDDGKGKKVPKKIGLAPIQREGMDFEFTVVLELSIDGHIATSSKDRTGLFDSQYIVPSVETGQNLITWLNSGTEVKPEPAPENGNGKKSNDKIMTALTYMEKQGYPGTMLESWTAKVVSEWQEDDLKHIKECFTKSKEIYEAAMAQEDAQSAFDLMLEEEAFLCGRQKAAISKKCEDMGLKIN